MAADAWVLHDKFKEYMGDGTIDLDGDSFKLALFQQLPDKTDIQLCFLDICLMSNFV